MISANRLGFWSAILTAVMAAVFFAVGFVSPVRYISYPYVDVASSTCGGLQLVSCEFISMDYIWLYPAFLLAPIFVVLMACIHYYAPVDRKIFSQIGLSFALVYAAVITTDYFIQWTVVQPSLLSGETEGLSLFTQYDPHGIFIALEGLGYLMMSVALLFAAAVFTGGRLERAVRWLFVMSFILAIGSFAGLSLLRYDIVTFEVTIIMINCTVLIVSGALLSILFKRAGRYREVRAS